MLLLGSVGALLGVFNPYGPCLSFLATMAATSFIWILRNKDMRKKFLMLLRT